MLGSTFDPLGSNRGTRQLLKEDVPRSTNLSHDGHGGVSVTRVANSCGGGQAHMRDVLALRTEIEHERMLLQQRMQT